MEETRHSVIENYEPTGRTVSLWEKRQEIHTIQQGHKVADPLPLHLFSNIAQELRGFLNDLGTVREFLL